MTGKTSHIGSDLYRLLRARKSLYAELHKDLGPAGMFLFAGWLRLEEKARACLGPTFEDSSLVESFLLPPATHACRTNLSIHQARRSKVLHQSFRDLIAQQNQQAVVGEAQGECSEQKGRGLSTPATRARRSTLRGV